MGDSIETGLRIRAEREKQKLTRERLAERANLSVQFLADIENGKKGMTIVTLKKICTALGTNAEYIVFGRGTAVDINRCIEHLDEKKQRAIYELVQHIIKHIM